jgi:hypothetical protein
MKSSPNSEKNQSQDNRAHSGTNGDSDPANNPAAGNTNKTRTGPEQTKRTGSTSFGSGTFGNFNASLDAVVFLERQAEHFAHAGNRAESQRFADMAGATRHNHERVFAAERAQKASPKDDPDEVPEAEPFPIDALAPVQKEMVLYAAESIEVHPNLPAIAALGIVAAAIGRGLYARSGPNQTIHGNLFLIGSAISGEGKTESSRPIVDPFLRVHMNQIAFHKNVKFPSLLSRKRLALKELNSIEGTLYGRGKTTLSKEERKKLQNRHQDLVGEIAQIEDELIEPAMRTEDCTKERMAVLMQQNREQLFAFSTDAGKAVDNLEGLYNRLKAPEDNFLVHAFSGDSFTVHRINRPAINLEHPCLTLFWLLQPIRFGRMFANDQLREAGFLARALICDTRLEPAERDGKQRAIPTEVQDKHDRLIRSLTTTYWENKNQSEIGVPPDGEKLFRDYQNELVSLRKGRYKDITSFIARWPEQARRIAIGLHAALRGDWVHLNPLSLSTIQNAIRIVCWFAGEQIRILEAGRQDQLINDMRVLHMLLVSRYPQGVTLRTLRKNHGKDEQFIERIVEEFPTTFELKDYQAKGGGRPTKLLSLVQRW